MRKLIVFLSLLTIFAYALIGIFPNLYSKFGKDTLQPPPTITIPHLNEDIVFNLVNEHRQTLSLPTFQKSEELCRIAKERSEELAGLTKLGALDDHKGFLSRYGSYPYKVSENIVRANTEVDAVASWLNSPPHRQAMESNWIYSCVSCTNAACSEIFSSFTQ